MSNIFTDKELKLISSFLIKAQHHLSNDNFEYSFDSDTLSFIDQHGSDTAYGEGAEIICMNKLSESEINTLLHQGYYSTDTCVFAFSRFLMLEFLQKSVLIEMMSRREKQAIDILSKTNKVVEQISEIMDDKQ